MQIDQHRHELLPSRECQQLPGELLTTTGGSPDRFDGLNFLWFAQPALQDLRIAGDDHQQIVEIMCDASGELSEGVHLLRLGKLLAGLVECHLRFVLRSNVTGYFCKSGQLPRIVANGLDQFVRIEPAAVLGHEPALRLVLPVAYRGDQGILRHMLRAIFFGVKLTEVLADNLVGAVALDLLGSRIPAANMPVDIEHVDGVVPYPCQQHPDALFGLAQGALSFLALGYIKTDAEHADGGTVLVADDLAHAVQMTDTPVAASDPLLVTEVATCFQGLGQARLHMIAIIGMDEGQEIGESAAKIPVCQPVDSVKLIRPSDPIFRD